MPIMNSIYYYMKSILYLLNMGKAISMYKK